MAVALCVAVVPSLVWSVFPWLDNMSRVSLWLLTSDPPLLLQVSHTMRSYIYQQSSVIGSQAEHTGMRTYYFSADTQEDMNTWLKAMNQAALMQNQSDTLNR